MVKAKARREALNLMAIRRATSVAVASTTAVLGSLPSTDVANYVRLSRRKKQLELWTLDMEYGLLDKLGTAMAFDDMIKTIFELMDQNSSGSVDAEELAQAFSKMGNSTNVGKIVFSADRIIEGFSRTKKELASKEFGVFIKTVSKTIGCPVVDLSKFILPKLFFSETGRQILESPVTALSHGSNSVEDFNKSLVQARLLLIFDMLDFRLSGKINFTPLAIYLHPFTEGVPSLQKDISDLVHNDEARQMDYVKFLDLILEVASAFDMDEVDFHELTNCLP